MNMLETMMALHVYMNEHVRSNDGVTCLYE